MEDTWREEPSERPSFRRILQRLLDADGIKGQYENLEAEYQQQQQQTHTYTNNTTMQISQESHLSTPTTQEGHQEVQSPKSLTETVPLQQTPSIDNENSKETMKTETVQSVELASKTPEVQETRNGATYSRSTSLTKYSEAPSVPVYLPSEEGKSRI